MKTLIEFIAKNIVKNPDKLKVEEEAVGNNAFRYTIVAEKEDMGSLIGKGGKVIRAIREVARIKAMKINKYCEIEVQEQ